MVSNQKVGFPVPLYNTTGSPLKPTKKSRVISKLSQLAAILGATLSKLGTRPL